MMAWQSIEHLAAQQALVGKQHRIMYDGTSSFLKEPSMLNPADQLLLKSLCNDLVVVEEQLSELEAHREAIRARLSELVDQLGGKIQLRGFGTLQISNPSVVVSYDRKGIEQLVQELEEAGNFALVDAIQTSRKESMRSGGLRIMREKL
ncbi:hypothetical protein ACP8Y2_02510 [Herpetosiphon llansteffanensis]